MKLVICEKPSVAKAVASALGVTSRADGCFEGNGLIVSWCVGHLVSPMDAAGYDLGYKKWKYDDLPILPEPFRYVLAKGKEDAFQNLKHLMEREDVTELVNACDAGREGELIFRLVYEMAGCQKPFSRLWISSMEDAAIREGFQDLRPGAEYDPLYQSALCRQKADWLIGINATRLFSVLYHRTLNVGRVQTPTLAMLVDRDSKITMFRKEKYHHVRLALEGAEAVSEKIPVMEDAQAIRDAGSPALLHCDAVQGFLKVPFTPARLGVDMLTLSGHKLRAPKGIGVQYIRKGLNLKPLLLGGGQESGLRSGTEPTAQIAALAAACDAWGEDYPARISVLKEYALESLSALPGLEIVSRGDAPHICAVSLPGYPSEMLVRALSDLGVYVSSGSACHKGKPSHVFAALGLPKRTLMGVLRISFGPDNTREDVDALVDGLKQTAASRVSL